MMAVALYFWQGVWPPSTIKRNRSMAICAHQTVVTKPPSLTAQAFRQNAQPCLSLCTGNVSKRPVCTPYARLSGSSNLTNLAGLSPSPGSTHRQRTFTTPHTSSSSTVQATAETAASFPAAQLDHGFAMAQGLRDSMEDELTIHLDEQNSYLYAGVFDGHGGSAAAQWLGNELHHHVGRCMQGQCFVEGCSVDGETAKRGPVRPQTLTEILTASFHEADKALLTQIKLAGGEALAGSGATATVALVQPERVVVANVGDSTAVLCRKGMPVVLANQHRVYGKGPEVSAEIERVKSVGGWVDDGRVCSILAVSRAFGDWEFKGEGLKTLLKTGVDRGYWDAGFASSQHITSDPVIVTPDVTETYLGEDDEFLIVATDGLWDVCPPLEALRWARKDLAAGKSAQAVADGLAALALKRYTSDNVAVVFIDLQGAERRNKAKEAAKGQKKSLFKSLFG